MGLERHGQRKIKAGAKSSIYVALRPSEVAAMQMVTILEQKLRYGSVPVSAVLL
jgi:hypothetical protein